MNEETIPSQALDECPLCRGQLLVNQYEWVSGPQHPQGAGVAVGVDITYKCLQCGFGRSVPEKLL